ncbi:hypothetical protein [Luteococcus peritonei]|uniref:Uncharacterized protein n=1 Tax=Luteococcus peritonei TaxID=88874 RepID=A0ABW4RTX9_9ACTN
MNHDERPDGAEQDLAWLGELLAADPAPAMPPAVADRILEALATEQRRRSADDFQPDAAPAELVELDERTSLGTFGPNPPSTYSPPALGLPGLVEVGGEQDDEDVD